jgi:aspartate kinase
MKFGGTSVGSAERMKKLMPIIESDNPSIVVLSAMSGTTNQLVKIDEHIKNEQRTEAIELIKQLKDNYLEVVKSLYQTDQKIKQAQDFIILIFGFLNSLANDIHTQATEKNILAQGEIISTTLFNFLLEENKIESTLLNALDFMRTNENQEPDNAYIEKHLQNTLSNHQFPHLIITQGFICRNEFGEVDNLKRGGSDYTATLIGAAIKASEIQIWTDIDGMHNNDPRIVDKTFPITELSYNEAAELAYFGAKILHPTCVLPAQKNQIPLRLLNTMQPQALGTIISEKGSGRKITAVAAKDGIVAINIQSGRMLMAYGFLRSVFEIFERYKTPIDMITTSEVAVSVTIDEIKHLNEIVAELRNFGDVKVDMNQTIVCVVGNFAADNQGYASQLFDALKQIPIRMISYGGSASNISILVDAQHKKETLIAINNHIFIPNYIAEKA